MLLGGDEFGRTQNGNNNAYCQDNEISWFDWSMQKKNKELYRFVKEMIAFRKRHPGLMRSEFYTGMGGDYVGTPDMSWYDEKGNVPDWDKIGYYLALQIDGRRAGTHADRDDNDFYIMLNADVHRHTFVLVGPSGKREWYRVVDTGLPSPNDIVSSGNEVKLPSKHIYHVNARSVVILISRDITHG
jgi:glycogen operon protein